MTARHLGPNGNDHAFGADGTMFALHSTGGMIVGRDQFSGATSRQSATTNLALPPFQDNMHSRNPSSTRAMARFLGTDDLPTGSRSNDVMVASGGNDTRNSGGGKNAGRADQSCRADSE